MFQRIIGIIGVIAVLGTITMVALTPKKVGLFPDTFGPRQFVAPDTLDIIDSPVPLDIEVESESDFTTNE